MKLPHWVTHRHHSGDSRTSSRPFLSPQLSLWLVLVTTPLLLFLIEPAFPNRVFTDRPSGKTAANQIAQADYAEEAPLEWDEGSEDNFEDSEYSESTEYSDPIDYAEPSQPIDAEYNSETTEYTEPYAEPEYAEPEYAEPIDNVAPPDYPSGNLEDSGDLGAVEPAAPPAYSDSNSLEADYSNYPEPEYSDYVEPEAYLEPAPPEPIEYTEPVSRHPHIFPPAKKSNSPAPTDETPAAPPAATPDAPPASPTPQAPIAACPEANLAATNAPLREGVAYQSNVASLVETALAGLAPRLSARPFPEIHGQARMARVPVIMYHDILPEKEVFFDVTPEELEADFQLIQQKGLTPISLDQLVEHLSTGKPLPEKPILLTFDDGYQGHYTYVYALMQKYGYPAVFAIYPKKVGTNYGRSSLTWEQLHEMAANPLVTIASHSITHPADLRELPDAAVRREVVESKRILETQLGIPIDHFVYPEGKYDARVAHWVKLAGYHSALTMNDEEDRFAGQSIDLLSVDRIGQSGLEKVVEQAYGGPPLSAFGSSFNFNNPVALHRLTVAEVPLIFATGGRPTTVHADSRYQVWEIMKKTQAVAAVDGGFFSLELLTSNDMIGPVFSHNTNQFIPANRAENAGIKGRPLVLMSPSMVKFIPYNPDRHNSLEGIRAELPDVTDAFVAAAWLVKDGQPQPRESFGTLFDFDAARDRAFWGIDQAGQPVVGVSGDYVDSITFGEVLSQAGLRDAVMLDSGASASLAYQGESMMSYEPRPVPHVVALLPSQPATTTTACAIVSQNQTEEGATGTN